MAFECVIVKQEPADFSEEADTEVAPAPGIENGSESNIKMEIEVPVPNIRVKIEPSEPETSTSPTSQSWEVPVTQEIRPLPEHVVQVTIKEECDSEDVDPLSDDDAPLSQVSSSVLEGKVEICRESPSGKCYVCQICKKSFANPGNVQRHLLLHTRETIKCDQCDGEFINKIRLDKHIFNKHTLPGSRIYSCDVCSKKFKSSSNLMQHKKTHLVDKPYKCPLCPRAFSFKTNLQKHQGKSRCKIPKTEPLICHVCQKVFKKEYLLKSHLRKHDTERPFACDQCSTAFKYKSTLIRHVQLHEGVRPFPCPVCGKTFTHAGLLKPHMRVHTGEKPYKCELCTKTFAHKHNMLRHMQRHEKVKHLVCDICHKEFPRESRLKYHMKIHVNEKYFICNVCPKRFSHKQNVLRHYTRKHPGQTYSCPETDASVALKVWDTFKSKYCDEEAEVILG